MLSHRGCVRKSNEDTCAADPAAGAFVVCDGMGGAAAGEVASRLAADTFLARLNDPLPTQPPADVRLFNAIAAANEAVYCHGCESSELRGMGTTLVALLLASQPEAPLSLTVAHVGDSRCYLFRDSTLTRLTEDHSLVEEQLRCGEITPAQAAISPLRNIITRAIGSHPAVEPTIRNLEPRRGDLYLLASDGLTNELPSAAIEASLRRAAEAAGDAAPNLNQLCHTLIEEANDHGGGDNVTVLLLYIV